MEVRRPTGGEAVLEHLTVLAGDDDLSRRAPSATAGPSWLSPTDSSIAWLGRSTSPSVGSSSWSRPPRLSRAYWLGGETLLGWDEARALSARPPSSTPMRLTTAHWSGSRRASSRARGLIWNER
jgi:hypothetical protein